MLLDGPGQCNTLKSSLGLPDKFFNSGDGSTPLNVTATDDAGNIATDVFIVTVGNGSLAIVPAVILTWSCGVLQESTDLLNRTDLPAAVSPFAAPTDGIPKKFWRIKP